MTLDTLIMLAGALVAVMPFLGFPRNWDTVFLFLLGVFVIALGIVVRRTSARPQPPKAPGTFVENTPNASPHEDEKI